MELIRTVHRLRAPGGCPWDREQTFGSLRPFLLEEAHEVLQILDKIAATSEENGNLKDPDLAAQLKEELGDLLLQVLLHTEIAQEQNHFNLEEVAETLDSKLKSRHPHVFGDSKVGSAGEAIQQWEVIKAKERKSKGKKEGTLDGVPVALPSLTRALRTIEKVSKVGFQWEDINGPIDKLKEELEEWMQTVRDNNQKAMTEELGDVLFTICNVSHQMGLDPESALRQCVEKFGRRFRHVEKRILDSGRSLKESNLQEMDKYWEEAKKLETGN